MHTTAIRTLPVPLILKISGECLMTAETLYNAYTSECTKSYKTQCGSPIVSGHPLIHYKSNLMQSQTSDLLWITTLWKNHFVCRVKWTLKPWTNNEWSYIYSLRMNKNTENWSYSRLLLLKLRRKNYDWILKERRR